MTDMERLRSQQENDDGHSEHWPDCANPNADRGRDCPCDGECWCHQHCFAIALNDIARTDGLRTEADARIRAHVSLFHAARHIGVTPMELSEWELLHTIHEGWRPTPAQRLALLALYESVVSRPAGPR